MEKKVLLASPPPGYSGGISRWTGHILTHYKALSPDQKEIELIFLPMPRSIEVGNTSKFKRIYKGLLDYWIIIRKYKKALKIHQPEVVHITSSGSISLLKDWVMLKLASRKKIKTIIHFRFGRLPDLCALNNWEWKLFQKVGHLADKVIVIDQKSHETLLNNKFDNLELLPNPLSPTIAEFIRNNKSIVPIERQILFVGQMLPAKGIFELVEACRDIPGIKLKMVGPLPEGIEEQLRIKSGQASQDKWLEICGEKDHLEIIKEMLSASIFVLPTYTEGFPNVILESMACGCPIIASAVGAIPEMLDTQSYCPSGVCIIPKNVTELKQALLALLNDRTLALQYGKNAQQRVNRVYGMNFIWQKLNMIWKSI